MGLRFHGPNPEPPNRTARMHNVVPGAKAYILALQSRLLQSGGVVRTNAIVEDLLREEGAVVGVSATVEGQPVEFRARSGVVLAAGDYANCPETIRRFKGSRFAEIEGIKPHATGDGHRLAEAVNPPS